MEQRGHGSTEGRGEKWKRTAWKSTFYFWEQEGGGKQGRGEAEGSRCQAPHPLPPRPSLAPGSPEVPEAQEATPAGRAQRAGRTGTAAAAWARVAAPSIRRSLGLASGGVCGNYLLIP